MTRKDELLKLAEQVENLDQGGLGIDRQICALLYGEWFDMPNEARCAPSHTGVIIPRYTSSLDAAMTLVPQGWRIYTADFSIKNRASWMLEGPKLERIEQEDGTWEAGRDWYQSGTGTTPEIGLTVACLVTLASQEPNT